MEKKESQNRERERERERRTAYLNTGVEDTFLAKPTVTVDSTFRVLEGAQR